MFNLAPIFAAILSLATTNDYQYTSPHWPSNTWCRGIGMGTNRKYTMPRFEDIAFLDEAYRERQEALNRAVKLDLDMFNSNGAATVQMFGFTANRHIVSELDPLAYYPISFHYLSTNAAEKTIADFNWAQSKASYVPQNWSFTTGGRLTTLPTTYDWSARNDWTNFATICRSGLNNLLPTNSVEPWANYRANTNRVSRWTPLTNRVMRCYDKLNNLTAILAAPEMFSIAADRVEDYTNSVTSYTPNFVMGTYTDYAQRTQVYRQSIGSLSATTEGQTRAMYPGAFGDFVEYKELSTQVWLEPKHTGASVWTYVQLPYVTREETDKLNYSAYTEYMYFHSPVINGDQSKIASMKIALVLGLQRIREDKITAVYYGNDTQITTSATTNNFLYAIPVTPRIYADGIYTKDDRQCYCVTVPYQVIHQLVDDATRTIDSESISEDYATRGIPGSGSTSSPTYPTWTRRITHRTRFAHVRPYFIFTRDWDATFQD